MKAVWTIILLVCIAGIAFAANDGGIRKRAKPYEYGMVTINNYSVKAGFSPVVFDHWNHRDKYTCRLCHVDIGFAMKGGATQIKANDNIRGYFCGACHNGMMKYGEKKVFAACAKKVTKEDKNRCKKCHADLVNSKKDEEFDSFAERLPKGRHGNGIDWEKAQEQGLIKPSDTLENVSIKREALDNQMDFSLPAKVKGMPDIIFSHRKHTVWNGCEVCHPDIFVNMKKGGNKYTMVEIFEGKFCGACHVSVAFPLTDCQRCHSKPIQ